jgi:hypothetical protein
MISFSNTDIEAITGYITDIVGDFMPIIVIFFGISIGFWVINKIIHRKDD